LAELQRGQVAEVRVGKLLCWLLKAKIRHGGDKRVTDYVIRGDGSRGEASFSRARHLSQEIECGMPELYPL
jgi:hypothetical protein